MEGANLSSIELLPELISEIVFPDQEPAAKIDHLAESIGDEAMVIVVDGVDGLVDQLGELAPLIRDCPGLALVLTSRSVIDLPGTNQLQLNGLPLRSADGRGPGAAPRLFPGLLRSASAAGSRTRPRRSFDRRDLRAARGTPTRHRAGGRLANRPHPDRDRRGLEEPLRSHQHAAGDRTSR